MEPIQHGTGDEEGLVGRHIQRQAALLLRLKPNLGSVGGSLAKPLVQPPARLGQGRAQLRLNRFAQLLFLKITPSRRQRRQFCLPSRQSPFSDTRQGRFAVIQGFYGSFGLIPGPFEKRHECGLVAGDARAQGLSIAE